MKENKKLFQTVLKAVALGISVASFVLGYLGTVEMETQVSMLSFGVFCLQT